jgi:hypothetical protein
VGKKYIRTISQITARIESYYFDRRQRSPILPCVAATAEVYNNLEALEGKPENTPWPLRPEYSVSTEQAILYHSHNLLLPAEEQEVNRGTAQLQPLGGRHNCGFRDILRGGGSFLAPGIHLVPPRREPIGGSGSSNGSPSAQLPPEVFDLCLV